MAALLAFLLAAALFVYQWFGPDFPQFYDRVFNFWSHLAQKAADTLRTAIQIAEGLVMVARAYASVLVNQALSQLNQAKNEIWQLIVSKWLDARNYALLLYQAAQGLVQVSVAVIKAEINALIVGAINQAISLFNSAVRVAQSLVAPFAPFLGLLTSLQALFTADNLNKLSHLLGSLFTGLTLFLTNPGSFILSVLWPRFVDLLCAALAYALGAEQTVLPPPPDWSQPK